MVLDPDASKLWQHRIQKINLAVSAPLQLYNQIEDGSPENLGVNMLAEGVQIIANPDPV